MLSSAGVEPGMLGAGAFRRRRASDHNGKCMELSRRNRQFYLVDMPSVPAKARQHITDDVLRGWRQGDFGRLRSWRGGDDLALNIEVRECLRKANTCNDSEDRWAWLTLARFWLLLAETQEVEEDPRASGFAQ